MKTKEWLQLVLTITGLFAWSVSQAEFRFIGRDARPEHAANAQPVPASGCTPGLRWSGAALPDGPSQVTQATSMPMEVALRRMVPAGWSVVYADAAPKARPITWRHKGSWQSGVDAVLRHGMACGTADAASKRLTVADSRSTAPATVSTGTSPYGAGAGPARTAPMSDPYSDSTGSAPAMTPGVSGGFEVRAGDTVRETLRRWAATAGWHVVWDASRDYTVEVSHRFDMSADFPQAAQALLDSYWRQGKPVKASMYSNKVLRVEDAQ